MGFSVSVEVGTEVVRVDAELASDVAAAQLAALNLAVDRLPRDCSIRAASAGESRTVPSCVGV